MSVTQEDIERLQRKLSEVQQERARLEGQDAELDSSKQGILAEFQALGVDPKDAEQQIAQAEQKLTEVYQGLKTKLGF